MMHEGALAPWCLYRSRPARASAAATVSAVAVCDCRREVHVSDAVWRCVSGRVSSAAAVLVLAVGVVALVCNIICVVTSPSHPHAKTLKPRPPLG